MNNHIQDAALAAHPRVLPRGGRRALWLSVGMLVVGAVIIGRAQAGGGHYYPPVDDPVVKEECGSCHMAYAPAMLPARSWTRMMGELKQHFGDDASVAPATAERIRRYLESHAGDAPGQARGERWLRAVAADAAPQRITELPKWVREHRKVSQREWRDARSKANCTACHTDAERGVYED